MADKWRVVTLGDVADLVRGVSYRPSDLLADGAEGIPLLRATNIKNQALELADVLFVPPALVRDHQRLRRFDVVIAMSSGSRDAVGRLAQLRRDWVGCVGAFCGVVRADPKRVHPEYLGYVLQSPAFRTHVETRAVGTAIMNLSRDRILGFTLRLPDLPEQSAIAHILGTLDDKIELNRKQNETLEAMARALFKAWFVDFEPVRAKMEGRWRRGETLPGLPAHLYDLFPDRLVESELGEIPEGWIVTNFGAVSTCFDSRRIPLSSRKKKKRKGSIPYYGATSVMDFVDEAIFDGVYLLLGEDGSVLKPNGTPFIQYIWGKSWVNNHAHVLQGAAGVSTEQLMLFISTQNISAYVTGAVQLKLNQKNMNNIPFVKAKDEINSQFSALIAPLFAQYRRLVEESRTLAALRDILLPKLISGELRVKNAEAFLQERGL